MILANYLKLILGVALNCGEKVKGIPLQNPDNAGFGIIFPDL